MNKKEFDYQKKLLELEHSHRMEELEFQEKMDKLKFDMQKQMQRIKSAEIKRTLERRRY